MDHTRFLGIILPKPPGNAMWKKPAPLYSSLYFSMNTNRLYYRYGLAKPLAHLLNPCFQITNYLIMETIVRVARAFTASFILFAMHLTAQAQDNAITEQEVGSWFDRNWMWVTGVIVLLLLIVLFSGGKRRSKTTTVVKDDFGNVKSVSTTEVKE